MIRPRQSRAQLAALLGDFLDRDSNFAVNKKGRDARRTRPSIHESPVFP
jgi:hypothetical protein